MFNLNREIEDYIHYQVVPKQSPYFNILIQCPPVVKHLFFNVRRKILNQRTISAWPQWEIFFVPLFYN
jgi:hypothetical protein